MCMGATEVYADVLDKIVTITQADADQRGIELRDVIIELMKRL